jgi:hypothetical protein
MNEELVVFFVADGFYLHHLALTIRIIKHPILSDPQLPPRERVLAKRVAILCRRQRLNRQLLFGPLSDRLLLELLKVSPMFSRIWCELYRKPHRAIRKVNISHPQDSCKKVLGAWLRRGAPPCSGGRGLLCYSRKVSKKGGAGLDPSPLWLD